MTKPKILAFAGSAKKESLNKKILAVAVQGAQEAGAEVTVIDLREYPLPIMDEDLEAAEGIPAKAKELRALFADNHGLLLACPEYNSSITPLLKNTIDWVSRPDQDGSGLRFFNDKTASLISASGGLGGLRGLVHVRAILGNIGVHVLPKQLAVSGATKLFNDDDSINDPDREKQLKDIGANLAQMTDKIIA